MYTINRIFNEGLITTTTVYTGVRGSKYISKKYSKNNQFFIKNCSLTQETVPSLDIFQKKTKIMDKPLKNIIQKLPSKTYKR